MGSIAHRRDAGISRLKAIASTSIYSAIALLEMRDAEQAPDEAVAFVFWQGALAGRSVVLYFLNPRRLRHAGPAAIVHSKISRPVVAIERAL